MKLDRWLAIHHAAGRREARLWVVQKRVTIDGRVTTDPSCEVSRFSRVELDGQCVKPPERRIAIMLYKPVGVLSATKDEQWPTVLDLIDDADKNSLHLVGRLDRSTSGLVLLTNDGNWSKSLMLPDRKVPKEYLVTTRDPLDASVVEAFAQGFHFHTEGIHTQPVAVEICGEFSARLILHEGRYHQIKRMFHRVGNRVIALHRERIGDLRLPADWIPGQWRLLTPAEMEDDVVKESAVKNRAVP